VRLSGAVRWDNVADDEFGVGVGASASAPRQRAWSPRAGMVIRLNDAGTVSLFSQVSTAFKVPTLDQLFDPRPYPDFRGGTFTISNRQLVPQRATNIEGGISAGTRVRLSAAVYRMAVADEIDFDLRTFSYANIGRSRHAGLELDAEGRLWHGVQPSISYVFSRVVTSGDNRQLKNVPRHLLSVATSLQFPRAVSAYVRYHHTWAAFLDDENRYALDGPSTLDFRLSRPIGRHTIFLDGLNVTGNRYEEYGFTLSDFRGQSVPYVYPGAPRAVRGGLTLSF
jgi:outer membrane cobalamin receptor